MLKWFYNVNKDKILDVIDLFNDINEMIHVRSGNPGGVSEINKHFSLFFPP